MPSINSNYPFDLEDKVTWDELAPSLQDKFKELWNKIEATNAYLSDRIGDVRLTIDYKAPENPIEYAELWFDARYMILRSLINGEWKLTTAAWYKNNSSTVVSTPEAPLSTNERTNCHCYAVKYEQDGYCHCKSQMWDPSTVPEGQVSDIAFNKKINNTISSSKYQWVLKCNMDSINVQTLNAYTEENPNANAIIPNGTGSRVTDESGNLVATVTYDTKYDPIFDENSMTSYIFNSGTYTIPFTYTDPVKLTGIIGRLAPYSNGPVTIQLQVYSDTKYITIGEVTLAGNPQYAITCHGACHCARW